LFEHSLLTIWDTAVTVDMAIVVEDGIDRVRSVSDLSRSRRLGLEQ
jgi:hypothetical protein